MFVKVVQKSLAKTQQGHRPFKRALLQLVSSPIGHRLPIPVGILLYRQVQSIHTNSQKPVDLKVLPSITAYKDTNEGTDTNG